MSNRSASELWDYLVDQALDEEMEAVLAMSPEERRRELVEAGFDLDEVHADAEALRTGPARPQAVAVLRPKRRLVAIALPVAVALAAGVALVVRVYTPDIVTQPPDNSPATPAAELRQDARDLCAAQRWQGCLDKLNAAKALDPRGEDAPEVQSLRRIATDPASRP